MKPRPLNLRQCLAMMRRMDPQTKEDGFYTLLPHAAEHLPQLIHEFETETDHGLRCWLLELIGEAKSPDAFECLVRELRSESESLRNWAISGLKLLDTKAARTALWEARSIEFLTRAETESFRSELDRANVPRARTRHPRE